MIREHGRTAASWMVSAGLGAALTAGIFHVLGRPLPWREVVWGWGLAASNAVAAGWIHRAAVRRPGTRTPLWGLAAGTLRAGLVFAIVLTVWRTTDDRVFRDFLLGFFPGYLVFFVREMASLYRRGTGGARDAEAAIHEH